MLSNFINLIFKLGEVRLVGSKCYLVTGPASGPLTWLRKGCTPLVAFAILRFTFTS